MDSSIKLFSEMESYEIININDGEKYNCIGKNDILIDDDGNLKCLILSGQSNKIRFFGNIEYFEVSWHTVRKIGMKTIILDAEEHDIVKI